MVQEAEKTSKQNPIWLALINLIRGGLIGIAEVIPGISGGTIALITGVYQRVINSAAEIIRSFLLFFSFSPVKWRQAGLRLREVSWSLLIFLGIGMFVAVFTAASIVEPLLENYPTLTKALFAGLILASLRVPIRLSGGLWRTMEYLVLVASAIFAFALTSIPRAADVEPSFLGIMISAALAVCALVLPGISGSYLLLALGMYAPTLQAVNERDFGYLGTFLLGAVIGLGSFVALLQWLLGNHKRMTLVIMTGLMIGSIRALWPWQSEQGMLSLPGAFPIWEIVLALTGAAIVTALIAIEDRFGAHHLQG